MAVSEKEEKLYRLLDELGITYRRHEHPPVYTVEEAQEHWAHIGGAHCKNLFLRNQKGNRHYLIVMEQSKKADLKTLSTLIGGGKLSFASPQRIEKHLDLEPGAVSPLGLLNDPGNEVRVILDKELKEEESINVHPNVNTATITLSTGDFLRFLEYCGNPVSELGL